MDAVDPVLMSLAKEFVQPGAIVWDVGANVGLFAFAAASLAGSGGRVVALEPDAWLVQLLRRSARRGSRRVGAGAGGAGGGRRDAGARGRSAWPSVRRAANYLAEYGTTQTGGTREDQTVVALTLDWLSSTPCRLPSVIKIDVEGAELEVLEGARGSSRPVDRWCSARSSLTQRRP